MESANTLSTTGYVGKNIQDYLVRLVEKAGGDITKAEHGMVCIDEIDKKGSKENNSEINNNILKNNKF